jgi:hypothetical protein
MRQPSATKHVRTREAAVGERLVERDGPGGALLRLGLRPWSVGEPDLDDRVRARAHGACLRIRGRVRRGSVKGRRVQLGLRENLGQFSLLVALNAFVGAMVELERSTLPLIGGEDFGLTSKTAVLSFIVAFGLAKALTNLGAGGFAARLGRRRYVSVGKIGIVAGLYPAVWGVGQIWTGHWSDRVGRKPLIVAGMLLQAVALALLAASDAAFAVAALSAVMLGAGTALVYPTLIAAISDAVSPVARAPVLGAYRFWRDMGHVAGGLLGGTVADLFGPPARSRWWRPSRRPRACGSASTCRRPEPRTVCSGRRRPRSLSVGAARRTPSPGAISCLPLAGAPGLEQAQPARPLTVGADRWPDPPRGRGREPVRARSGLGLLVTPR